MSGKHPRRRRRKRRRHNPMSETAKTVEAMHVPSDYRGDSVSNTQLVSLRRKLAALTSR